MSAPGYSLTPRARELLAYLSQRDTCPTFEEMRVALGLRSKENIDRLIRQLEQRGYIRRLRRRARAIEVLRPLAPASTARIVSWIGEGCALVEIRGQRFAYGPKTCAIHVPAPEAREARRAA